ncbi:MAG TPA: helix-turn-helix transcriptional regulator [Bryobacteraceae bacterium]|nr:helix-turn-helix transcriptional regulator [Bryobacteraceae bacterium]
MDRAGEKLRRIRERLKLTYRDVAKASQEIARRRGSSEFTITLSRLADIENGNRAPSVFRIYTLCAIYRLDLHEVLEWYGVPVEELAVEGLRIGLEETHSIQVTPSGRAAVAPPEDIEIDVHRTTFLSQFIRQWGKIPLSFLSGTDHREYRYGLLGLEDWSMHPILRPGSLLVIDQGRRRIARGGWTSELDRPIYFLEHRDGFLCGWCSVEEERLLVQPHPSSEKPPSSFRYPDEIDVIGQVVGVAMFLDPKKRARVRQSITPAASPNRPDKAASRHPAPPEE